MSLISFTPLADGVTGVVASATNTPLSTIYNDYNGNITNANIASNAAIAASKISFSSTSIPYKFSVYRTSAWAQTGGLVETPFDTANFDTGSNVDLVTNKGRFTAPVAGFYLFTAVVTVQMTTTDHFYAMLYKNGSEVKRGQDVNSGSTTVGGIVTDILSLATNDFVEIYTFNGSGVSKTGSTGSNLTHFSGVLLSAT